jgi:hypothetical protein
LPPSVVPDWIDQLEFNGYANGWSAAATFEGEFSNVTSSYAGKGVVRYTW